jgi:hypothetical protein
MGGQAGIDVGVARDRGGTIGRTVGTVPEDAGWGTWADGGRAIVNGIGGGLGGPYPQPLPRAMMVTVAINRM